MVRNFPEHNAFFVDVTVFVVLFSIAYISANLAIKAQYIIMGVIVLYIISIVIAAYDGSMMIPTSDALSWGKGGQIHELTR